MLAAACLPALAQNGTVVVYRPGKYVGSALKPSIYADGNEVGRLKNGRYLSLQLTPGKHNLESSMKKAAPLEVDVKPNETVYLMKNKTLSQKPRRPRHSSKSLHQPTRRPNLMSRQVFRCSLRM